MSSIWKYTCSYLSVSPLCSKAPSRKSPVLTDCVGLHGRSPCAHKSAVPSTTFSVNSVTTSWRLLNRCYCSSSQLLSQALYREVKEQSPLSNSLRLVTICWLFWPLMLIFIHLTNVFSFHAFGCILFVLKICLFDSSLSFLWLHEVEGSDAVDYDYLVNKGQCMLFTDF